MSFLDRILGKRPAVAQPPAATKVPQVPQSASSAQPAAGPPSVPTVRSQPQSNTQPTQAIAGPACSLCGRSVEPMDTAKRYATVTGGPFPTLYKGVVRS